MSEFWWICLEESFGPLFPTYENLAFSLEEAVSFGLECFGVVIALADGLDLANMKIYLRMNLLEWYPSELRGCCPLRPVFIQLLVDT